MVSHRLISGFAFAFLVGAAAGAATLHLAAGVRAGRDAAPGDVRVLVRLPPAERDAVLGMMRANVVSIDGVLVALSESDPDALAAAAREMADTRASDQYPVLREILPPEWRAMGSVVHREMAALARDVQAGLPPAEVPGRLARVTAACVACHERFRL